MTQIAFKELEINNFMSISAGKIKVTPQKDATVTSYLPSLIGIYGPNGSGKSSITKVFFLLRSIMSKDEYYFEDNSEDENFSKHIRIGNDAANFVFSFDINSENLEYSFSIKHTEEDNDGLLLDSTFNLKVFDEVIKYKGFTLRLRESKADADLRKIANLLKASLPQRDDAIKELSFLNLQNWYDTSVSKSKSFFSVLCYSFERERKQDDGEALLIDVIKGFVEYCGKDIYLFGDMDEANLRNLQKEMDIGSSFIEGFSIQSSVIKRYNKDISENDLDLFTTDILEPTEKFLQIFIPTIAFAVKKDGTRFLVLVKHGKSETLFENESYGIKKLFFLFLHLKKEKLLVIDEFDEGIYEDWIGKLLKILETTGKQQVIFTAHNLRPLEVLNKKNLYFSTLNPENRFITLKNVKTNNNLRDLYIKCLATGTGQEERLFKSASEANMYSACLLYSKEK